MSRHFLLDGYNLIKQAPCLADLALRDGRASLLHWIHVHQPQGSVRNSLTVVYDGNPEHFGNESSGQVKVVFANYQSADDYIKSAVDQAQDKKKFVVVSDDRGITLYVRSLGASVLSVKEFAPQLFSNKVPASKKMNGKTVPFIKNISVNLTKKINDEFEKIWLK